MIYRLKDKFTKFNNNSVVFKRKVIKCVTFSHFNV